MNLNDITNRIKELSSNSSGKIESKIKFIFNDGCIFIDDTVNPIIINNEDKEADCTITIDNDDFEKILKKEMDSMGAFMSGKMKIGGEMTVAMKLSSLFD
jgi:putative sterol carrier protein